MKVAAYRIDLQSSHQSSSTFERHERLEVWGGGAGAPTPRGRGLGVATTPSAAGAEPGRALATGALQISTAGRAALAADSPEIGAAEAASVEALEDPAENDPQLALLIRMIEFLTGEPVRRMRTEDLRALSGEGAAAQRPAGAEAEAGRGAGFGMAYELTERYAEQESVAFRAGGVVRTADGGEIRFEIGFAMSRSYSEEVSVSLRAGAAPMKDPLVLDFGGPAAALSDLRFAFDLDGDGRKEQLPMAGGAGFLAFDRNASGRIEDGRELFGPASGDGFAELAALDDDGNGWIDEADAAWSQLRIWRPDAHGEGSLKTLEQAGVGAFYLDRVGTPFSLNNAANEALGQMRASSIYLREDGSVGTVSQVDLRV